MTTFVVYDHMIKSVHYKQALIDAGFELTKMQIADVVLSDIDMPQRITDMKHALNNGASLFIYPHSAVPPTMWDYKSFPPSDKVTGVFVQAPGHVRVMRAYGCKHPAHVVGWSFCKQQNFHYGEIKRILYAPIHPIIATGYLNRSHKYINAMSYDKIVKFCRARNIELTVRFIGEHYQNSIPNDDDVRYVQGFANLNHQDIDEADLVISSGTFAYMAVARGKPTIFTGQDYAPVYGKNDYHIEQSPNWKQYTKIMRYPFELLEDKPMEQLIESVNDSAIIQKWRSDFIGEPFDGQKVVNIIKSNLGEDVR